MAAVALVLAAAALVADTAAPRGRAVAVVAPLDLARWIRDSRPGLDVIDTRPAASWEAGHVPSARNVPAGAFDPRPIGDGATVVLYGDGSPLPELVSVVSGSGAANVFVLERGLDGWLDDVMAPRLAESATAMEKAEFQEQAELSRWFGGLPRIVPDTVAARAAESTATRSQRLLGGC